MDPQPISDWSKPIRYLRGVGEQRAAQLARLDIHTVRDLLLMLPRRYEDRRLLRPLRQLVGGEWSAVQVEVVNTRWAQPRYGKGYLEATVRDSSRMALCRWFNARYLESMLPAGARIILFGRVSVRKGQLIFDHPEVEIAREGEDESLHVGRIVPVYPLTENLGQRTMRRMVAAALETFVPHLSETLPEDTRARWKLMGIQQALHLAHYPEAEPQAVRARERLVFEEFLCMQLILAARKHQADHASNGRALQPGGALRERFFLSLPFVLTNAQREALAEIQADMARTRPMHRLLQGDVGSGKTVVAATAAVDAIECGKQVAVMAPTEILAQQHARTFRAFLKPLDVRVDVLTSGLSNEERIATRAALADGRIQLIVGTHALIQEHVTFHDLGLIIIDEQHKFGVEQRGQLYEKGFHPHILVMTATPIPRTLAMTWYGDLDVSTIRELPAGRQPIVTRVISEKLLPDAYDFIRKQVGKGRQAYLVYPLVSESEQLDLKAATAMMETLRAGPLASLQLGLVHGQMRGEERDRIMEKFRRGDIHVLIATSVIEVGVDVPNATVMLVENAEHFGLAQLHQLRGRIGRGAHKSFCVLQGHPRSRDAWKRLKIMEETNDGFRIAEEDFRIRGMGNLLGREQSGGAVLRVGDPLRDTVLLEQARQEAFRLIEVDPRLRAPEHALLREEARALYRASSAFVKVG